ncbi:MAG: cytochrome c oxidase subunit 3 [Gammaproteobacteria bacterium]|nr:cytochrome c oxidase subunit 3 [Gammaproteobacteria bacterium]NNF62248.1 cytochrome c oxidase subunit 3 [Gammaproteobacteria bacterium]NNM21045.1 cytochrome c oxidase subunit 3 [Gammaproteobacteria bacterium]
MDHTSDRYYIPHGSPWPIVGSIALLLLMFGVASTLNGAAIGRFSMMAGAAVLLFMLFGWFGVVIKESVDGYYNQQVDRSFRMGMAWFIASEVMFFAAFFGALFYARQISLPWLAGESNNFFTNFLLWPGFENAWPSNGPAEIGGEYKPMGPWGLPAINTAILLTSGVTITIAHHALRAGNRGVLNIFLGLTWLLGFLFVGLQAFEYMHAYHDITDGGLSLRLDSGIYGSTFFMLTGFHGLHVTLGATMLIVIWFRCLKGHFTPDKHFGFEGVAWYWHFVDVVWLGLFIFVYWL